MEVETAEMKADREEALAVQAAMSASLSRRVAPLLIIGGAGVTLALLSTLGSSAEPNAWLWLLPGLLVTAWGLALRT